MSVTVAMETAANEAIPTLKYALLPFNAFSTDYSAKTAGGNQTVQVPVVGTITSNTTENSYEQGSSSVSKVDVTLGSYIQAPVCYTDVEQEKLESVEFWRPLFEEAYYEVSYGILAILLANVTAANCGAAIFTGGSDSFDYDAVVDSIWVACNAAKWSPMGRSLLLTSAYTGSLLKDTKIANNLGIGGRPVTDAELPTVAGFAVRTSDAIPGNSENLIGLACSKNFMGVAMRPPTPGVGSEKVVNWFVVTDPETGASMGVRTHYSAATGKTHVNVECRYGYAVVSAARCKRLVSA